MRITHTQRNSRLIHASSTSTVDETLNHIVTALAPLAHQLNYTVSFFDIPSHNSSKHITVSKHSAGFNPAPITSGDSKSFELLAGTGKAAFGNELVVSPTGMFGRPNYICPGSLYIQGLTDISEYRYTTHVGFDEGYIPLYTGFGHREPKPAYR